MQTLLDECTALGYGINLGTRPDQGGVWSCAIFAVYRKEHYKGLSVYACKQGRTMEEALSLCLAEVKNPPVEPVRPVSTVDVTAILAELDLFER